MVNNRNYDDRRTICPECGEGMIRLTEKQKQALKKAIHELKEHGFEVTLVKMYQAEPVMMALMISKKDHFPSPPPFGVVA